MSTTPRSPLLRPWQVLRQETLGEYTIFSLTRSVCRSPASGHTHEFLRLHAPDWVNVVAVTESLQLILVEQFRHGTDAVCLEIPGGAVDAAEEPQRAALRELEEETGYRPRQLFPIGVVEPNPAFLDNRCHTYLAVGCEPTGQAHTDPSEELAVHLVPLSRFTELIDGGTIRHSLVIAAHDHLQRGIRRKAPWSSHLG